MEGSFADFESDGFAPAQHVEERVVVSAATSWRRRARMMLGGALALSAEPRESRSKVAEERD